VSEFVTQLGNAALQCSDDRHGSWENRDVSTGEGIGQAEDDKASTFQPVDLGRLGVDGELSFGESLEAAGIGFEEFLEDLAAFFNDNLSRRAR
jgi:hypothetical protein